MIKRVWEMLTTPDEYDGVSWFDCITTWLIGGALFTGLAFAIRFFC